MLREIAMHPFIQPLYYVVHRLFKEFGMSVREKTGLKTYPIFLMILEFVRQFGSEIAKALETLSLPRIVNSCLDKMKKDENDPDKG